MRQLATIRHINSIDPIPNADQIEVATVDGWKCVVKRGEFKVGDPCVYLEIDSYLPVEERYEFLRKSSYRKIETSPELRGEGFRLKTVRLRGQISQGLALPLSLFPELAEVSDRDITELLRIEKWDPPVPASLRGEMAGNFPGCVAKTDQERIQNLPEYFEKYADLEFEITEKIDGCSMTAFRDADHFGICSHNWELRETAGNSFWGTGHRYDLEGLLRSTNRRLAIQCELAGPGIQSNRLKLKAVDIFAFDVWDIDQQRYLTAEERIAVLGTRVRQVPIIEIKPILKLGMAGLLSYASGPSLVNPGQAREGIVAKSTTLVEGRVISFKVISNQYLLTE